MISRSDVGFSEEDLGYFWSHFLLGRTVGLRGFGGPAGDSGDPEAARLWQLMPKQASNFSAPGPNYWIDWERPASKSISRYSRLVSAPSPLTQAAIHCDVETPMWKLKGRPGDE